MKSEWSEHSPIALHCPLYAARSSGVLPVTSLVSTLAPWLSSNCIQSRLLWKAATWRGVHPRWSLKFTTNGPKCLISSSKHCSLPWKLERMTAAHSEYYLASIKAVFSHITFTLRFTLFHNLARSVHQEWSKNLYCTFITNKCDNPLKHPSSCILYHKL